MILMLSDGGTRKGFCKASFSFLRAGGGEVSGKEIDLQQVKELVKLVEKFGLAELAIEESNVSIVVKGMNIASAAPTAAVQTVVTHEVPVSISHEIAEAEPVEAAEDQNIVTIESPMVGVFYRSASPDSPPFVEVGDEVEVGQTVGLIEAMKVFSEIPSEVAGVVMEIPGQNGKLAHQGDPLVKIRTA
jgi:acetyl-CoA carboxylase biotin carboxyl carrier protein